MIAARSKTLQVALLFEMILSVPAFAAGQCPHPIPDDPTKIGISDLLACVKDLQNEAAKIAQDVTVGLNARVTANEKELATLKEVLGKNTWVSVPLSDQEQFDLLCEYRWTIRGNINMATYSGLAPYTFYAVGVRHDSLVASNGLRQFWIYANTRQIMYFTNKGQPDGSAEVTSQIPVDKLEKKCG